MKGHKCPPTVLSRLLFFGPCKLLLLFRIIFATYACMTSGAPTPSISCLIISEIGLGLLISLRIGCRYRRDWPDGLRYVGGTLSP